LRLRLLREAVRLARRVAYLGLASTAEFDLSVLRSAAVAVAMTVLPVVLEETLNEADIRGAFQRMADADVLLVALGAVIGLGHGGFGGLIVDLAAANRLPSLVHFGADATGDYVTTKALMNYRRSEQDTVDAYTTLAGYVVRMLGSEKPANLPVFYPTKFDLIINMKTAKALGLALPQSLLSRAKQVIE
jgi:putative ABC transport system substrate-binding protein